MQWRLWIFLNRAVGTLTLEVSRQKKLAIEEMMRGSIQSENQKIARALASAAVQFRACLRDHLAFVDRLRSQDDAIPALFLSALDRSP